MLFLTNNYLKKEIDEAFQNIKIELSELDAEIRLTATNATRKTIVVNSDVLLFLEKYGFTVISLDDTKNPVTEKTINEVKDLIKKKEINHIFILEKTTKNNTVNNIIK